MPEPGRPKRRPRRYVVLALVFLVAVAAYFWLPGPITAGSIAHSISREAEAAFPASCALQTADRWRCTVGDQTGSGGSSYRIMLDGSCWEARRIGPNGGEGPMPLKLAGCVRLRDLLRLIERVVDLLDS